MTNKNEPRNEKGTKPARRPYQPPRIESEPVFDGMAFCSGNTVNDCGGGYQSS